jgi:uncharacterized membrane protein
MNEWIKTYARSLALLFFAFIWSSTLVLARVAWTWNRDYLFLGFNLGLAMLPLFFSVLTITTKVKAARVLYASLWLLFLPNAPYIITDLIHLQALRGAPAWYDVLMISSCAGTGLAAGFFSLAILQSALLRQRLRVLAHSVVVLSCFATAFGIYLGRFLRWHSVHVFSNPGLLFSDIADRFLNPFVHPRSWAFTLGFGTLLTLGYSLWRTMTELIVREELSLDREHAK